MTPVASLENVTIDSTTDYNTNATFKAAVNTAIENKSLTTAKDAVTTNANGQAVFTELPVGVYLAVSYTHLDVYKRQTISCANRLLIAPLRTYTSFDDVYSSSLHPALSGDLL